MKIIILTLLLIQNISALMATPEELEDYEMSNRSRQRSNRMKKYRFGYSFEPIHYRSDMILTRNKSHTASSYSDDTLTSTIEYIGNTIIAKNGNPEPWWLAECGDSILTMSDTTGRVIRSTTYKDGLKHGASYYSNDASNTQQFDNYFYNMRHGTSVTYNLTTGVKDTIIFEYDRRTNFTPPKFRPNVAGLNNMRISILPNDTLFIKNLITEVDESFNGFPIGIWKYTNGKIAKKTTADRHLATVTEEYFNKKGIKIHTNDYFYKNWNWVYSNKRAKVTNYPDTIAVQADSLIEYQCPYPLGKWRTTVYRYTPYNNGSKDGLERYYSERGVLLGEQRYTKGTLEGTSTLYDTRWNNSGYPTEILHYRNGKLHGTVLQFNAYTGDTISLKTYVNGKENGVAKEWHHNGTIKRVYYLKNGVNNGVSQYYTEEGEPYVKHEYRSGKFHGTLHNFKNGVIQTTNNYFYGLINGPSIEYRNGIAIKEKQYRVGQLHGTQKDFYPNGKIEHSQEYHYNIPHGEEIFYRKNGSIYLQKEYRYGTIIQAHSYRSNGVEIHPTYTLPEWNITRSLFDYSKNIHAIEYRFHNVTIKERFDDNGRLLERETIAKGAETGVTITYKKNGAIKGARYTSIYPATENYQSRSKFEGLRYSDGPALKSEVKISKALKVGVERFYGYGDSCIRTLPYKNGIPHGVDTYFTTKGDIVKEVQYKKGIIQNITEYYSKKENKILSSLSFKNGLPHGEYKSFHENGKLHRHYSYKNGLLHGKYIQISPKGIILDSWNFKNGERVGIGEAYWYGSVTKYEFYPFEESNKSQKETGTKHE